MTPEWLLFCALACIPVFRLLRSRARRTGRIMALTVLACAAGAAAIWSLKTSRAASSRNQLHGSIPRQGRPDGYVSSEKCQACHPNQYASWHQTFHRTMTQAASRESVVGNFENVDLELLGRHYHLERQGDEFWVELDDPEWQPTPQHPQTPRIRRRVGLLTGSHHMQAYWLPGATGNLQSIFAFAWLIPDHRWVPFHNTFLRDPAIPPTEQHWNMNCINCHSTGGQPRPDPRTGAFDTRVGELGIACEACHGPAQEHVQANQIPWRRYQYHDDKKPDPTIVNPRRLPAKLSSQICGQCHGIKWISHPEDWRQVGFRYRPGEELSPATPLVRPARLSEQPWLKEPFRRNPRFIEEHYWSDGMVRVSGREYNGLIESPCHERGELSCLSCHSLHKSKPDAQVAEGMETNQACLQCHKSIQVTDHTRHRADSSGSECYNCHMPRTTYGLLKAIRSHQIDSPNLKRTLETGRPIACNLCHLDKTLAWTTKYLSEWYGQKMVPLSADEQNIAAALLWLLKGDAGQRALLAWSMGWKPAKQASGQSWLAPFLGELLTDPYSAVRSIAYRSLVTISADYRKVPYDFVGSAADHAQARQKIITIWKRTQANHLDRAGPELLIESDGTLNQAALQRLATEQNHRSMDLQE